MENVDANEVLPLVDDGDKKRIVEGGINAFHFIRQVVRGEKVDGKRYGFDADFIKAINKRVCSRMDYGGRFREENVGVDALDAVSWHQVPTRFYLFSNWLEVQMNRLERDPDDIVSALEVAAGAHYGLTQPELHPFPFGNGRTARALANAILMYSADELRLYKIAVPPIPILRSYNEERDMKYIKSLRLVRETGILTPLMTFLAKRWSENLSELLQKINKDLGVPKNPADRSMIDTLTKRKSRLDTFISVGLEINGRVTKNNLESYPIPNYFDDVWLKRPVA